MSALKIHPRVFERHPQLAEEDVRKAWNEAYYEGFRLDSPNFPECLRVGEDGHGRQIEMVGVMAEDGWLVFHANTPLSKRVRMEVDSRTRRSR